MFVRNPYYYVVDPAGNQLPYIDRVQFEFVNNTILPISAANGDASMQDRGLRFKDYTELMSRRAKQQHPRPAMVRREPIRLDDQPQSQSPNSTRPAGHEMEMQLLADKRFRQAVFTGD